MKTKRILLLLVLFTMSVQAQLPSLAEKNYYSKFYHTEHTKKMLNTVLNEKVVEEKEVILKEFKNYEKKINNKKDEYLSIEKELENIKDKKTKQNLEQNKAKLNQEIKDLENERTKKISEMLSDTEEVNNESESEEDEYNDARWSQIDYIDYFEKLFKKKVEAKIEEIEKIELEIVAIEDFQIALEKKEKIDVLRKEINDIENEKDSIIKEYKNKYTGFFPSWKKEYRNDFFGYYYKNNDSKTSYLNSLALNYNNSGTVIQSELVADTFGPLRISLGTVVQSNDEVPQTQEELTKQKQQDHLETLLNGGGNFYIETILPVLTVHNNTIALYSYFNNKTATEIKGFSNEIDTNTFNTSLGSNLYFGMNSDEKKFNVFVQTDFNVILASKLFYQNLQLAKQQPFFQGKLIVGVTFLSKFRLAAILNSFGSDEAVRSGKVILGLQIIPQFN
ncbi:conserved exported hypothetical protein [Flavobacterium sp. 9AF]|uniref:hypothetical protein n=1 Tax=Flavobacterium sp. 9AF TaxID=2653142 RepID=UPI0012F01715|nr:hypothetical protein [Flavobacterium sp. 9AF]VXB84863.1 conserved exported hypothetical protein [Flavobacterium sp. 9AF]